MNILILHSQDGQDHAYAILYPGEWTTEQADELAVEAFTAGQKANPNEWNWDDLAPELIARGFTVTNWHHGPTWDRQRVEETEEV